MPLTTKSSLAAELEISGARVSQYVSQGLPERSDGKLDRSEALRWVSSNVQGPAGARARQIVGGPFVPTGRSAARHRNGTDRFDSDPITAAMLMTAAEMLDRCGPGFAEAALQAGVPVTLARTLVPALRDCLAQNAEQLFAEWGVAGFGADGDAADQWAPLGTRQEPNWSALETSTT